MSDAKKTQSAKAPSELRGVEVSLIRYGRAPSTAPKASVGQTILWACLEGKQGEDDVRLLTMHDNAAGLIDEIRLVLSGQPKLPLHFADVRPGHESKHEFGDTKFVIDVFGVIEKKASSGVINRFSSHAPAGASAALDAARAAYVAALRDAYANTAPALSAEEDKQLDVVTDILGLEVSDIVEDEAAADTTADVEPSASEAAAAETEVQEAAPEAAAEDPAPQEPAADETPVEPESAVTEASTEETSVDAAAEQEPAEAAASETEEAAPAIDEAAAAETAADEAPEEADQTFGNEKETSADYTEKDLSLNEEQKVDEELPPEQTIDTESAGAKVADTAYMPQSRPRRERRALISPEEAAAQLDAAHLTSSSASGATAPVEDEKPAEPETSAPVQEDKEVESKAAQDEAKEVTPEPEEAKTAEPAAPKEFVRRSRPRVPGF